MGVRSEHLQAPLFLHECVVYLGVDYVVDDGGKEMTEMKNIEGLVISNRSNIDDSHLGQLAKKVRNRSPYSFANINLLGNCNVDCFFCLGKDLEKEFSKYQNLTTHFSNWPKWDEFIGRCKSYKIPQIYITGQNTDSLLYRHLDELIETMKKQGFCVGLRTNGLLALKKMETINKCTTCWGDAVSYSIHTLNPDTQEKIMRVREVPNWDKIIRSTTAKLRIAIVFNRHNANEIFGIIKFLSNYDNIEYVQVRKICTDNRYEQHERDMEMFEEFEKMVDSKYCCVGSFESANIYTIYGKKVSFWRTVGTTVNSINYFSNGTLSDDYFIIEGYSLENGLKIGSQEYTSGGKKWPK